MNSPDPVQQAAAYQAMLLAALGDDDPAEVQATTPAAIRVLLAEAGADLRTQPSPGEWSVLECVGHILDGELVMAARYRWVLAEDVPQIVGYDQALWVERLRHGMDDPAELLALFEPLRQSNVALWGRTTTVDRARYGVHNERGSESLDLMFRMLGGHDRVHLAQARAALAAVRATRS
jgi:DinB family protein